MELLVFFLQAVDASWVHDYGPTLAVLIGFVVNGLIVHGKRESDIAAIRQWTDAHEKEAQGRDQAIGELRSMAVAAQANARAQSEALILIQQELRDNRMRAWEHSEPGMRHGGKP